MPHTPQDDRVIRVFVSSTFRDMQAERDDGFPIPESPAYQVSNSKGIPCAGWVELGGRARPLAQAISDD
ncbi:MAG: hypothetical protein O3A00_07235 [Planctomycetota bacterium]|nr:hypothetical protein [Planctomycetota bacterium]